MKGIIKKATIAVVLIVTIATSCLTAFASTGGYDYENTFHSATNVQNIESESRWAKYSFGYQEAIIGNPERFNQPESSFETVAGKTIIWDKPITFEESMSFTIFQDSDANTHVIPMQEFEYESDSTQGSYTHIIVQRDSGYWFIKYVPYGQSIEDAITDDSLIKYSSGTGWYPNNAKTIIPTYPTELEWGSEAGGSNWFQWFTANSNVVSSNAFNGSDRYEAVTRTLHQYIESIEQISSEHLKVETRYRIPKEWFTSFFKTQWVRFTGQNVVIPDVNEYEYPTIAPLADVFPSRRSVRYSVRYTYFFNESVTDGVENWVVYTGTWQSEVLISDLPNEPTTLIPKASDIFSASQLARIKGIIYDEWESTLILDGATGNVDINITDNYYRGDTRRKFEVAGYFDEFRRNFDSDIPASLKGFESFGAFISSSVGGFFRTPLFGNFALGDAMLVIIGIVLVIVFLKIFAGG